MGFALPGAIAASLVEPGRKIIGIAGDAGFLMNVQEMETATRLNSNITMMIWEDNAYGLIAWKQWAQFGRHTDLSFNNPDWSLLAASFSWDYKYVDDSRLLLHALLEAAQHNGPSLIVIPIDYNENQLLTHRLGEMNGQL
jgi:acetolactate synthase-1/2/3 large subunit